MFLITTNSTCYISVLLLWSQYVPVYCFSGNCLMHWTVPVECLADCYWWLVLVGNINCFVCDCGKKNVALMLLRAYRAAGLRLNMLKDNIEMDIRNWYLWPANWTQFYQYIILRSSLSAAIFDRQRWTSWPVDLALKDSFAHTLCVLPTNFSYATLTAHRCT